MIRRLLLGVLALALVLAVVCVARAARLRPYQVAAAAPDSALAQAPITVERFTAALRFPTISPDDRAAFDGQPFLALHEYLRAAFPRVHAQLTREVVGGYSLLYTWSGSDPALDPMLLMGHLDVVPVERGTESDWTHPPFAGEVADGFVWGRGTLDDKSSVIAILEAVELLLSQDFRPRRTIHLAFGHDEELGGHRGAGRLAAAIAGRTKRLAFLVDEGGVVSEGIVPGVSRPVAMIGVAEKAALNVELTVTAAGGHSSMPPRHTAVGILSRAITRLEEHPLPARLTPVSEEMFVRLAPEMAFGRRVLLANLWLVRPLLVSALARDDRVAATLRTTTAATMVSGSPKSNVLPLRARAIVNFRILPGDTPDDVVAHVRRVVADTAVHIAVSGRAIHPSPVADYRSPEYALLERTVGQLFPGAVPVPFLMIGGTDTRHYESLTRNVFRFNPIVATPDLVSGAHGTNERVRADDFVRGVRFFAQLIRNAQ
jgi:carboxypeptidase PM20D1